MKKINLSYLVKEYEKKLQEWIDEALEVLKDWIDKVTPVDTRKLKNNNKIIRATIISWWVKWSFENKTPYAWKVEFWEWMIYRYHDENRKVFHIWDWVHGWAKTWDEEEENIKQIIKNKVLW